MPEPAYLIVNADDYAFFNCVSKGILECIRKGTVTATGIFANSPYLEDHAPWLMDEECADIGVHLNLTSRFPLTRRLSEVLIFNQRCFADKFTMTRMILTRQIKIDWVRDEWCAQIERCLGAGLRLRFLNSHEHIHMLPSLYKLTLALAKQYGIKHVRMTTPEWLRSSSLQTLLRDGIMGALAYANQIGSCLPTPRLLGMGESGRLSQKYLATVLPKLRSGRVYELMCHPGIFDPDEIKDRRLLAYHDWDQERLILSNPLFRSRLAMHNVILIGYRQLGIQQGILQPRFGKINE